MDSLLYVFFSATAVICLCMGVREFGRDGSADSILYPALSLFLSILLIFSSRFIQNPLLFSEAEGYFLFAFWVCVFLLSLGTCLAIGANSIKSGVRF